MKNFHLLLPLFLSLFCLSNCSVKVAPADEVVSGKAVISAYVGTYTRDEGWVDGQGAGIYELAIQENNGQILQQRLVKDITNPSFVVESADEQYLYAVSELAQADEPTGFLYVLDVADNFREVAKLPTDGKAPCHIEVDQTGNYLITSNYVGGVSKLFRRQRNGSMLATDKFQVPEGEVDGRSPHLHSAQIAPDNQLVAIADLGLDRVWLFSLDGEQGRLVPKQQRFVQLDEGAGPRHMQWSADGRFLYVINELSSTLNVLGFSPEQGTLVVQQTITTLPAGWAGNNSCADLHLHPSGKFLYGSNRGHNSIVAYAVDESSGKVTAIGHTATEGATPRNFALAPSGRFLYVANQNSSTITVFSLNEKSGQLTYTNQSFSLGTPVCLEF